MILTKRQEEGLRIAVERHRNGEKYTVISGYAGTGKSTLVRFIIEALDVEESRVCYATYTGKAAEVLRKKGNKNACTLHRLLYDHIPRPAGGFFRRKKPHLNYDVIVVDEVSMAPKPMMDLLFTHQVYVICLGDPFQIPPIDEDNDNHLLDNPHIFLDEIMRQEAESEIVRLSMDIREMKPLEVFHGNNVQVFNKRDYIPGMLTWADQILVATNAKRLDINKQVRAMKGLFGPPQDGDKLVCLRNYWDDIDNNGDALVNGLIGTGYDLQDITVNFPARARTSVKSVDALCLSLASGETGYYDNIMVDKNMIMTGEPCIDWRDAYKLGKLTPVYGDLVPKQFAYGYAITCHKAQGSEWDNVLVFEESFPFDRLEHARWLYTACTRAADKLVVIKNS